MFLTCNICKHSSPFSVEDGAPAENMYQCRKEIPVPQKNQTADFPIVPADWECDNYRKSMGS